MDKQAVQQVAQLLQRDLGFFGARLCRVVPGFRTHFAPVVSAYSRPFLVKRLRTGGAFRVGRPGELIFNYSGFRLFHGPIDRLESAGAIPPYEADVARSIAVEQLVVHELAHVSAGLIAFSDVQVLKALAGPNALGEDDLQADIAAAKICSRLEMLRAQEKRRPNYATRLLQQLLVMGSYALPAFGAPSDKPHKRRRFLGLAMMAARIHGFLEQGGQLRPGELAFDIPIYPLVDPGKGQILLSTFSPQRTILGSATEVDRSLLNLTLHELEHVPFQVSVARAAILLREIGPVTNPVMTFAKAI